MLWIKYQLSWFYEVKLSIDKESGRMSNNWKCEENQDTNPMCFFPLRRRRRQMEQLRRRRRPSSHFGVDVDDVDKSFDRGNIA